MPPRPIEVLRVAGSHREVGHQLGEAARDLIRAEVETSFGDLPAGRSRDEQLELAARYRDLTAPRLPWLIEELDACAEAAGVDAMSFFATSIEELWYEPRGRCSDLVAGPGATADGHLLVAHTNDLRPSAEEGITAMEISVPGDPVILQLGAVPGLSVGFNSAGLSLTGNELSPNDERVGISRSHQVLDMMRARSFDEFVARALAPDRASSYNNVLCAADGGVANIEGSATTAVITQLDEHGHLSHTNHYVAGEMLAYEGDPVYAERSRVRYERACTLLAAEPAGSITMDRMRMLLADHETAPDSLCRHPGPEAPASKTVFWCVVDVTDGVIVYGRGNPCDSVAQEYRFEGWAQQAA